LRARRLRADALRPLGRFGDRAGDNRIDGRFGLCHQRALTRFGPGDGVFGHALPVRVFRHFDRHMEPGREKPPLPAERCQHFFQIWRRRDVGIGDRHVTLQRVLAGDGNRHARQIVRRHVH